VLRLSFLLTNCLDVTVHCDADIGMAHQFFRCRHVRTLALNQSTKCVTKRVPANTLGDPPTISQVRIPAM
jgi:hypothetical protein